MPFAPDGRARTIIHAGWAAHGGTTPDPDGRMYIVEGALDHDRLLPRCRAAVHHEVNFGPARERPPRAVAGVHFGKLNGRPRLDREGESQVRGVGKVAEAGEAMSLFGAQRAAWIVAKEVLPGLTPDAQFVKHDAR